MLTINGCGRFVKVPTCRCVDGLVTQEQFGNLSTIKVCEAIDEGLGGWEPEENLHIGFTDFHFKHTDGVKDKEYRRNAELVLLFEANKAPWKPASVPPYTPPVQPPSVPSPTEPPTPDVPVPTEPLVPPANTGSELPKVLGWKVEPNTVIPDWIENFEDHRGDVENPRVDFLSVVGVTSAKFGETIYRGPGGDLAVWPSDSPFGPIEENFQVVASLDGDS